MIAATERLFSCLRNQPWKYFTDWWKTSTLKFGKISIEHHHKSLMSIKMYTLDPLRRRTSSESSRHPPMNSTSSNSPSPFISNFPNMLQRPDWRKDQDQDQNQNTNRDQNQEIRRWENAAASCWSNLTALVSPSPRLTPLISNNSPITDSISFSSIVPEASLLRQVRLSKSYEAQTSLCMLLC